MYDTTTSNRQYTLPHAENALAYDNPRLRSALIAVDADMKVALDGAALAQSMVGHTHTLGVGDGTIRKLDWVSDQLLNFKAGANVSLSFDHATNSITISTSGQISGNVDSATRLQSSRTIALTGSVTGQVDFDGSANVSIITALANTAVTAGSYGSASLIPTFTVDAKGRLTAASGIAPAWAGISGKPSTLAGYGITDAQPYDDDLTALAGMTSSGMVSRMGFGFAARTITGGADITVTNGDGVAANPTIALSNTGAVAGTYGSGTAIPAITVDAKGRITNISTTALPAQSWANLQGKPNTLSGFGITDAQPLNSGLTAVAALASTGIISRTAAGAAAARTIVASTGISILNGDGVSGNPQVSLANTAVTAGSYGSATSVPAITIDAQGRIISAISTLIKPDWSNVANKPTTFQVAGLTGGTLSTAVTMGAALTMSTGATITLSRDAVTDMEPVTKRTFDAGSAPLSLLHAVALSF